jgi:4-alpha-glucanotransferase
MKPSGAALLAQRTSGVLLHLTSLPGPHGSGDMGAEAYHFVDWLEGAGQHLWQLLPLSPVGPGYSPYHSPSTFAGNPLLIDLDALVRKAWLKALPAEHFESGRSDFDRVAPYRMACLRQSWQGFLSRATSEDCAEFTRFRSRQAHWLEGYALFMALEARYGAPWTVWPQALAHGEPLALATEAEKLTDELGFYSFIQWCFSEQWQHLRDYARQRGVFMVGDAPIFVAHHSADVWMNAAQYQLDADGQPLFVAGVPPDHFSETGQRWGNPVYRWDEMAQDGYAWWCARITHLLQSVEIARLDHFRGFESYWEIPASEPTAEAGCWRAGPGKRLFEAIAQAAHQRVLAGALPLIAEDLGVITPAVTELRQACGFPGMRVMQFAFGDTSDNPYLPHNFDVATVAYTGTHDNDTTRGWWDSASAELRDAVRSYLGPQADTDIHWAMIQSLSQSVARSVIFPLQDVLGLDGAHRMNTPGVALGCWQWRFEWKQVGAEPSRRLAELARAHGRHLFVND